MTPQFLFHPILSRIHSQILCSSIHLLTPVCLQIAWLLLWISWMRFVTCNMSNIIRRYKVLPEIYTFPIIFILLFSMPPTQFTPFNSPEHLPECLHLLTLYQQIIAYNRNIVVLITRVSLCMILKDTIIVKVGFDSEVDTA